MKKALSLILSLVIVIGLIPMAALPAFAEETATQNETEPTTTVVNVYNTTVPETDTTGKTFASLIGTTLAANTTYKLMEDIYLDGTVFNGSTSVTLSSGTTIDGQNHSITGYSLSTTADNGAPSLFSISSGEASIINIALGANDEKIAISANNYGVYAGAMVSMVPAGATLNVNNAHVYVNYTKTINNNSKKAGMVGYTAGTLNIENSTVNGYVGGTATSATYGTAGFIAVIQNCNVTIKNCVNNATIDGGDNVGGIVGNWQGNGSLTIEKTVNNGNVTGTAAVGGCIGNTWSGEAVATDTLTIDGFINNGNVKGGTTPSGVIGNLNLGSRTGGTVSIKNSVQNGTIEGTSYASGYIAATSWKYTIEITNCINNGTVKATSGHAGGAIGDANINTGSVSITDFLNTASVTSTKSAAAGVGVAQNGTNTALTITATRLVNTGAISGTWNPATVVGWAKNATLKIYNCVAVGSVTAGTNFEGDVMAKYETTAASVTADGNIYVTASNINNTNATQKAIAEALTILNNADNSYKYGPYTSNSTGTNIVVATPEFEGYQLGTTVTDNIIKLRLLATINDVNLSTGNCEYTYLGFKITVDGVEAYSGVEYVYTAIKAKNGETDVTYTAEELGGKYIYAKVLDLDAAQAHTVIVQTFASDVVTDNPADTDLYYGAQYTINVPAMVATYN